MDLSAYSSQSAGAVIGDSVYYSHDIDVQDPLCRCYLKASLITSRYRWLHRGIISFFKALLMPLRHR